MVALCQAPFLLDDPNVGLVFPADAIARAKHYLSLTSGGLGNKPLCAQTFVVSRFKVMYLSNKYDLFNWVYMFQLSQKANREIQSLFGSLFLIISSLHVVRPPTNQDF